MRARNIKPGFFENEDLVELSPICRLFFIGLWCIADREGRLEDRPRKIKLKIAPYDELDGNDILQELTNKGFLTRYSINGQKYISIPKFLEHQKPHPNEKESIIPPPPEAPDLENQKELAQALLDEKITEDEAGMTIEQAKNLLPRSTNGTPRSINGLPLRSCSSDSLNPCSSDSLNHIKAIVEQKSSPKPKNPKKKSKKPPENKPKPGVSEFIDYYHNSFLEKFGAKPKINGGKDGQIIKNLLGTYKIDELKELLNRFFESTDPFILQSGYSIGVFTTQINKLIVGLKVDPKTASRFLTIKNWEPDDEE